MYTHQRLQCVSKTSKDQKKGTSAYCCVKPRGYRHPQTGLILEDQRLELAQQGGTLPGGEIQSSEGQHDSFVDHYSNGQLVPGPRVVGIASPQIGMILADH